MYSIAAAVNTEDSRIAQYCVGCIAVESTCQSKYPALLKSSKYDRFYPPCGQYMLSITHYIESILSSK